MESAYDRKFKEMKMYIPFLEDMIKRLENTSSPSANPRQAQLDKIRSLRDLLQDKKKRMKMENLLKCEQVLVNLYAKVEQKDTSPGIKKEEPSLGAGSSKQTGNSELSAARNKLQSVVAVTKKKQALEQGDPETLPEIARASETEEVCVPGSKEPALFQRRPNKASKSPTKTSSVDKAEKISPQKNVPKRNYTRVLVSPEPSTRRWSTTEDPPSDKQIFSRRSHRRSLRRHSPPHKKDKKKFSKQKKTHDLNITVKVPEEMSYLNTKDIGFRIIECDDNDEDIDKLRVLQTRILEELEQTGIRRDDIPEIMKNSCRRKKKRNKEEIEEGELSDSESEAIQSVYGNLDSPASNLFVDEDKDTGIDINKKTSASRKEIPKPKIQIHLEVNSNKRDNSIGQGKKQPKDSDETVFEIFDVSSKKDSDVQITSCASKQQIRSKSTLSKSKTKVDILDNRKVLTIQLDDEDDEKKGESKINSKDSDSSCIDISSDNESPSSKPDRNSPNQANFYKPLKDQETSQETVCDEAQKNTSNEIPTNIELSKSEIEQPSPVKMSNTGETLEKSSKKETNQPSNGEKREEMMGAPYSKESVPIAVQELTNNNSDRVENTADDMLTNKKSDEIKNSADDMLANKKSDEVKITPDDMLANKKSDEVENAADDIEIPLLNTEPVVPASTKEASVSEIDILQALKNEILSESIAIPGAELATPPLHQPKVTKVSSAKEVIKKRISIEKYKEKSAPSQKNPLFVNEPFSKSRDCVKKTSLKLTEEEQKRFKNILPLSLDDSSDEENYIDEIYSDLAPKSPENNDSASSSAPPIIIPSDPVKPHLPSSNSDVDMRTLIPTLSPNAPKPVPPPSVMPPSMLKTVLSESGSQKQVEPKRDPRMRRDLNNPIGRSSPGQISRAAGHFSNVTPNITPNARSFEMTPSHQSLDFEPDSKKKHVYAPIPAFDPRDNRDHSVNNDNRELRWERNSESASDVRRSRWDSWNDSDSRDRNKTSKYDDRDYRGRQQHDSSQDYRRSRYDSEKYYSEPNRHEQRDDYSHNRIDCPRTPVHPFGRSDCPSTPNPSFGRVDTPTNFYGRKDCPTTPIHTFGRSDRPTTPSHPFGRSDSTTQAQTYGPIDRPMTPSHSFGRSDVPTTHNQFGRSEAPMTPSHPFGRSDAPMTPSHPFGRSEAPLTPSHPFGRSEAPMTPSHPFGRSDAPMTPSHPFGRSDAPMTPSHSFGRSDAPMTPSHPFGRSDAPMTPSHSFGRSDAPMTPSHPFGRSDAPMTPSHSFGRSDAPLTPSHPFGRTDLGMAPLTPNHPFGRSEHSKNSAPKDPRLNRNNEYDSSSRGYDENRDRGYYRDRSDGSSRSYNKSSESHRYYREQSIGRIEKSGQHIREKTPGREPSVGRGMSYDKDSFYSHHGRPNDYRRDFNSLRNCNEGENRRDYRQRAQSVGRSGPTEDRFQASSRQHNHDGNNYKASTANTLSVTPQTGRSFIIDTSVNTTFQEFLKGKGLQTLEYSFEDRRRRATSVGRTLSHIDKRESNSRRDFRESSVGRTLSSRQANEYTSGYKTNANFVRARSMGRELSESKYANSFTEVKADLISYRDNYNKCIKRNESNSDPRSRRAHFERKQESKYSPQKNTIYSPRKNYRDPRMYREQNEKFRKYEDTKKTYGIVYSNDNIARGTILGSGYGVKNYKIPKIKRPVEEPQEEPRVEEEKDINLGINKKKDTKDITKVKNDEKEDSKATVGKNNNASSKPKISKSKISDKVSNGKTKEKLKRKAKKAIINSDSDSETVTKTSLDPPKTSEKLIQSTPQDSPSIEAKKNEESVTKTSLDVPQTFDNLTESTPHDSPSTGSEKNEEPVTKTSLDVPKTSKNLTEPTPQDYPSTGGEKNDESKDSSVFNSNFEIDDLDMFPEHMPSDSVLSSINALIEDLDKEIGSSKDEDLLKEDAFDRLLENIDSPENVNESSNDLLGVKNQNCESVDILQQNTSETKINAEQISEKEIVESKDQQSLQEQNDDTNTHNDGIGTVKEDASSKISCSSEKDDINMSIQPLEPNIQTETCAKFNSEPIVSTSSTTEIGNDTTVNLESAEKVNVEKSQEVHEDRSSTPDSTINTSELQKAYGDGLPDSTNEKKNTNSDITSTLDQAQTFKKDNEHYTHKDNSSDSIGNLLSILQDKTKIKELLSMLGDQSGDNEKIKKKLEKLSSIVSDDEEENDSNNHNENTAKEMKLDEKTLQSEETPQELKVISSETSAKSDSIDKNMDSKNDCEAQAGTEDKDENCDKPVPKVMKGRKKVVKRTAKGRKKCNKSVPTSAKRLTRAAANLKANRLPRELLRLEESLKEMGSGLNDILNDTGIRSCRLAKMMDDKPEKDNTTQPIEPKPVVILEKFKEDDKELKDDEKPALKQRKKPCSKPKSKLPVAEVTESTVTKPKETKIQTGKKYKPGPKSKKNIVNDNSDPGSFEDSVSEATTTQMSEQDSCSESESMASSKSFGSSEVLADLKKKPKRKRRYKWNSGIISARKKKKTEHKKTELSESSMEKTLSMVQTRTTIPDMNCFTDKTYCFLKNVQSYPCRLCHYTGVEIVKHYKTVHPHAEIPLSRMHAVLAREAIEQCEDINFQTVSKMPTEKYVCRFCYEEFGSKRTDLEEFFWHVVSTHTGEYKKLCSECVNVTRCPFNLDIPPPPKDLQGQLIGYICGKCHFTQISLENLKMHVIVRHNDEQTAVYTINLAVMSKKSMNALMKQHNEKSRTLRSTRSSASYIEPSDASDHDDFTEHADENSEKSEKKTEIGVPDLTVQSKLTFEPDNIPNAAVKVEIQEIEDENAERDKNSDTDQYQASSDILDYPHFKIYYGDSGAKEYVCCINGKDNHYKTSLIISMKTHVKSKHSEVWDGYCSICKVIVMPQGQHSFRECLQHMLDNHIDNIPVIDSLETESQNDAPNSNSVCKETEERPISQTPYINVRPLSDLLTVEVPSVENSVALPKIESVISLGAPTVAPVSPAVTMEPATTLLKSSAAVDKEGPKPEEPYKYEEWQSEVMAKKHLVILDAMLSEEKLVHIYKCAGRYCPFTTDSADLAVLHASTHQRVGGENSLTCAYCDFDSNGNAIDLVMHVFKTHGPCKYVCGQCFYRAVASQLVLAHMHRVHGSPKKILETATATPLGVDSQDVLPRDVAVQHYACSDLESSCKFKTYTQGKFIEHLQKHRAPYLCSICTCPSDNTTELLLHLKTHGLKLYQCTWCFSGCDNEAEFLAHTSARHPNREPQAYLRVITNNQMGGETKTMVLPLVKLNKSSVATHLVTSTAKVALDPVREAEKALDLEKIITSTSLFGENKGASATVQSLPSPRIPSEQPAQLQYTDSDTTSMAEVIPITQPRLQTPPPSTPSGDQDTSLMLTPVLKTEPGLDTPRINTLDSSEIICLDSDDDDPTPDPAPAEVAAAPAEPPTVPAVPATPEKQNIIELDDEDSEKTNVRDCKKVDPLMLYKCKRCQMQIKKPQGFKRHLQSCYYGVQPFECAHCSFTVGELDAMFDHYQYDHGNVRRVVKYFCEVCNRSDRSLTALKTHMKKDHDISYFTTTKTSKDSDHGGIYYTVSDVTKTNTKNPKENESPRSTPKRKLSGGSVPESSLKRIRYGPQDLFKLPQKPILDELTYCSECEFNTKVRLNLVRHIQLHAENQAVPQTAPVNPVPHLQTNEKHFDKMVNLASSSFELTRPEKAAPTVTLHIPAEAASRYPKYVPDRQRHTCGAKGCSYISVDEVMLKCHWETLHNGSNDFHCVHCPPYQYLDTSKPLTSVRILAHLKMHDSNLYACSSCAYYHYRKPAVEKHVSETHKGTAQVMIVREENTGLLSAGSLQPGTSAAPTMDLKPWKCGLCEFKSMLRPEVVDHCSKSHNTKMQFKCPACPFRASTIENVKKHQSNSHSGNTEDVFYYYYREGSLPDEADGTPRWLKQRQKMGIAGAPTPPQPEPEVKTETPDSSCAQPSVLQTYLLGNTNLSLQNLLNAPAAPPPPQRINLGIVKKEVPDSEVGQGTDDLCRLFGDICDPNGLKYKCPLCKLVMEDSKDDFQCHLFEELQYRRWGCSVCSYKAFHKTGLNEHVLTEHRQLRAIEPKELPVDMRVGAWVDRVLQHQSALIEINKSNLEKHKTQVTARPNPPTSSKATESPDVPKADTAKCSESQLENLRLAFGEFGKANGTKFCCPKCEYQTTDEGAMKNHLEIELNKIRWRCSVCSANSQNYHEAQLHSKTCKRADQQSRPVEAVRDPNVRASWVANVIQTQREAMEAVPEPAEEQMPTGPLENSLLVVRYEERVPTPEEQMINMRKRPAPVAAASSPDSDEERLVIDDLIKDDSKAPKKKEPNKKCPYCPYGTQYQQALDYHILRHYKLRPITCMHCGATLQNNTASLTLHQKQNHPDQPLVFEKTLVPSGPPLVYDLQSVPRRKRGSASSDETHRQDMRPPKPKEDAKKDDGPILGS